jgi:hypothetical protein
LKISEKVEDAEKYVDLQQYPPIVKSLFWFGYFAKKTELRINMNDHRDRFCYQIKDMRLFGCEDLKCIHVLAMERLQRGNMYDEEMEFINKLAYENFSETAALARGEFALYWMAGYTFVPTRQK